MKHFTIISALLITFATQPMAEADVCVNNLIQHDMCKEATRIRDLISPELPQKISQNLVMRSISSFKNTLTSNAMLLYDRVFLETAVSQGGRTMDSMQKQMEMMTQKVACSMPYSKAFIELGGIRNYIYQFQDGEFFLEITVKEC